ncbi:hypothetical protein [Labrys miyagiensis]|uniref:hypothetical protein n=1 Tax=Labrys miyagiensis TaxID=346912 RepID=UPI0024E0DF96|nr:hypothetical protein [Labrys miyagiensis]
MLYKFTLGSFLLLFWVIPTLAADCPQNLYDESPPMKIEDYCHNALQSQDGAIIASCQSRYTGYLLKINEYNDFIAQCKRKRQQKAEEEERKKRKQNEEAKDAERSKKEIAPAPAIDWSQRLNKAQQRASASPSSDQALRRASQTSNDYNKWQGGIADQAARQRAAAEAQARAAVAAAEAAALARARAQAIVGRAAGAAGSGGGGIDYPPNCQNKSAYAQCADVGHNACGLTGRACWGICSNTCND